MSSEPIWQRRRFDSIFLDDGEVPSPVSGKPRTWVPIGSGLGVFSKGKRVFHVDPEIAHRILHLADETHLAATPTLGKPIRSRSPFGQRL